MENRQFSRVSANGRWLVLKRELEVVIEFDQENQEFLLEYPELNIVLGAKTREELWEEFCRDFFWLWDEYGKSNEPSR
ncbi:hypothetical protein AKJ60_00010 [candidate division MSBL1 archaeon SCGC-AAA385M11]|nr:hypothetical protein AKJ60_00010 [candidate division MSBL1 archaeon SCGC-AAA385M11]